MHHKILLIIAQRGFQSKEYFDTREVLQGEGMHVVTAAPRHEMAYSHMDDAVMPDLALSDVHIDDYDGVFAIGGPGALEDLDNKEAARIFVEAQQRAHYPYGAICISPRILATAGVLKGVRATGWDGDGNLQSVFDTHGVLRVLEPVVADGVVVTANGPLAARDFGKKIIEVVRNN